MDDLMYIGDKEIVKSILLKYQKIYGKVFARSLMRTMLKDIQDDFDNKETTDEEIFAYTE